MKRREFLKTATVAASAPMASMTASSWAAAGAPEKTAPGNDERPRETTRGDMRYRTLGQTREWVSAIRPGRASYRPTKRGARQH